MEAVAILEAGTKAIGLLKEAIELASKFKSRKTTIFERYIEPGFSELRPIIEAYIQNIAGFREAVPRAHTVEDVVNALRTFERNRVSVVLGRQKVLGSLFAAITSLSKYMDNHPRRRAEAGLLLLFLKALTMFFRSARLAEDKDFRMGMGSVGTVSLIESADRLMKNGTLRSERGLEDGKNALAQNCDSVLRLLEERISGLNMTFTLLKLECVG